MKSGDFAGGWKQNLLSIGRDGRGHTNILQPSTKDALTYVSTKQTNKQKGAEMARCVNFLGIFFPSILANIYFRNALD